MRHTTSMMLLWRFAASEASRAGHESIEPEHFVQAMTRRESFEDEELLKVAIPDAVSRNAARVELALIPAALDAVGINAASLRRSLRFPQPRFFRYLL